jgi:transcription termination factor Rho
MSPRKKAEDTQDTAAADAETQAKPARAKKAAGDAEAPKKRKAPARKTPARKTKAAEQDPAASDAADEATNQQDAPDSDANERAATSGQGRANEPSSTGSSEASEAGGGEQDAGDQEGDGGSRNKRRSRRSRSSNQQRVNYRDLQGKIEPELHLLAKEVGLEDFRSMEKDDLAVAILEKYAEAEGLKIVTGYLEISSDGYGFLQESMLETKSRKVIVSAGLIKQFRLRTGDVILGKARPPRNNERYGTLIRVEAVNGIDPFQASKRPKFDDLTPTFPEQRIKLETTPDELSARVIDLLAPIGRGQRGLIVAPPKAGKTTLLKAIARSVVANEPDLKLITLLVDERPEEVTDFRESVQGVEVVASTFDEPPTNHIRVAEFVHERARRIVEEGGHVMILLDSITRLARANNLVTPPTGRTLSGGLDSSALHWPKRFLGAARNIRGGGSLSILATALVETGSRMDDVIFEEFKGTGNMELHLSRRLEERRIFPAIDILKSGTRREDLLLDEDVLAKMWLLRKVISDMDAAEAMEMLLSRLKRTDTNEAFLATLGQG